MTWLFQFKSIRTINVLVFVSLFFLLRQSSLQFINFYDGRNRFHLNDTTIMSLDTDASAISADVSSEYIAFYLLIATNASRDGTRALTIF